MEERCGCPPSPFSETVGLSFSLSNFDRYPVVGLIHFQTIHDDVGQLFTYEHECWFVMHASSLVKDLSTCFFFFFFLIDCFSGYFTVSSSHGLKRHLLIPCAFLVSGSMPQSEILFLFVPPASSPGFCLGGSWVLGSKGWVGSPWLAFYFSFFE